jgi:hypothetical protein
MKRPVLDAPPGKFRDNNADALAVQNGLVLIELEQSGNYAKARRALERLARQCHQLLGPTHNDTLVVRSNLALMLRDTGDHDAAEAEGRAILAVRTETFGAEHPDTIAARDLLVSILLAKHELQQAERELITVLRLLKRVRGPRHPDTIDARRRLAIIRMVSLPKGNHALAAFSAGITTDRSGRRLNFALCAASAMVGAGTGRYPGDISRRGKESAGGAGCRELSGAVAAAAAG